MTLPILRRFGRDARGNVAMIFAFAIIPLLGLIGLAVDFSQATRVRGQLQNATDSAALAVARDGLSVADTQLNGIATKAIAANFDARGATVKIDKLTFDRPTVTAEIFTSTAVQTTFLQMIGFKSIPIRSHSQTKGLGVEIAMVLDTSGSMDESAGGSKKITALKEASKALLDTLYGTTTVSNRFNVGIVPFAASVNVGTAYKSANWMDKANSPANPEHTEDWTSTNKATVNRFSLFKGGANGMLNVDWKGCVMTRPAPYDIDDTAPGTGATLFVPWFAPDESDGDNNGYYGGKWWTSDGPFYNNYLNDEGGVCANADQVVYNTDENKQGRTCKYKGVNADLTNDKGPNYLCDSQAITPLTNARATLDTAVNNLNAKGNTNIVEGFMWGWRVLSSNEPFAQGKPYGAPNNRKVIILMTDGQNNFGGLSNANMSYFFAYGYAKRGNSGAPVTNNNATLTTFLDNKTKAACTAAKAKGITIYSIAFGAGATASQTLLKGCATDANYYFAPQNSSDLKPVFLKIAESINALRIAQ